MLVTFKQERSIRREGRRRVLSSKVDAMPTCHAGKAINVRGNATIAPLKGVRQAGRQTLTRQEGSGSELVWDALEMLA